MKKIAFILALIMILGSALWGCDTAETDTTGQAGDSSSTIEHSIISPSTNKTCNLYIEEDYSTGKVYAVWALKIFHLYDVLGGTYLPYLKTATYGPYAWIFNVRADGITLYKLSTSGEMEVFEDIYPEDVGFTEMTFAFPSFLNENNGFLFFWRDNYFTSSWPVRFLKTADGGKTWEMYELENAPNGGHSNKCYPELAKFLTENVGIISYRFDNGPSDCAKTYVTSDGGKTWNSVSNLPYPDGFVRDNTYSELVDAYWSSYDESIKIEVRVNSEYIDYTLCFKSYDLKEWILC